MSQGLHGFAAVCYLYPSHITKEGWTNVSSLSFYGDVSSTSHFRDVHRQTCNRNPFSLYLVVCIHLHSPVICPKADTNLLGNIYTYDTWMAISSWLKNGGLLFGNNLHEKWRDSTKKQMIKFHKISWGISTPASLASAYSQSNSRFLLNCVTFIAQPSAPPTVV